MTAIRVNGAALLADASGALWWAQKRLLAVADLHLEKGSAFARHGQLLPPYDSRATLERLLDVVARYQPQTLVCLGDSFHDQEGPLRLPPGERATLSDLAKRLTIKWVTGNHDGQAASEEALADFHLPPLVFRHEAERGEAPGEVSGHFHPKARLHLPGRSLSLRCFVTDGRRIILPAFGAYTGGLDARDAAIADLFPKGFEVIALGDKKSHRFPMGR